MREISHSYFNNASDFFISKLQPFHNLSVFIEVVRTFQKCLLFGFRELKLAKPDSNQQ